MGAEQQRRMSYYKQVEGGVMRIELEDEICDDCGEPIRLYAGGAIFNPDGSSECSPFTSLMKLCPEHYAEWQGKRVDEKQ